MDPRLLLLVMKAQSEFSKSSRMDDVHGIAGQFIVHDMLDIIGAGLDRERQPKPAE